MRINSTEVLGQAIRARRKELGYSQQQMADYWVTYNLLRTFTAA